MRIRIKVNGRVQGVGFRYFLRTAATERALTGWARNCSNGTVECVVQGEETVLQNFVSYIETGHAWAKVVEIIQERCPEIQGEPTFEIRH